MRHFSLIRFLAFSSFASNTECWSSNAAPSRPTTNTEPISGTRVSTKLQSALTKQVEPKEEPQPVNRRRALQSLFAGGSALALVGSTTTAQALDMDAFVNSQLEADTKNCDPRRDPKCKPEMSKDEAMCKYGQSGPARGEACKRVKEAGGSLAKPGSAGKSLGGAYAM